VLFSASAACKDSLLAFLIRLVQLLSCTLWSVCLQPLVREEAYF
jgi:hypothetical protein